MIALKALIGLATGEDAGHLGSSWKTILRTLSDVETLVSQIRRSPQSLLKGHRSTKSFKLGKLELDFPSLDWQRSGSSAGGRAIGRFFSGLGFGGTDKDGLTGNGNNHTSEEHANNVVIYIATNVNNMLNNVRVEMCALCWGPVRV